MVMLKKWVWERIERISLKNRIILLVLVFGILPMLFFSSVSYFSSKRQIVENAKNNLLQNVKKNNELITNYLERVEEAALMFTIDPALEAVMNMDRPSMRTEILHRNLDIKESMNKYFLGIPKVFSTHLYTDHYRMVGNYTISNYKPPMYVPYDAFADSFLYEQAAEAKGRMRWIPTYRFEDAYEVPEYEGVQYNYEYLFSAVKQINCVRDESRMSPVLIISFQPSFFEDILESREELGLPEASVYYIVDEAGHVVYDSRKECLAGKSDIALRLGLLEKSGTKLVRDQGVKYLAAYDTLALMGWKQIILVPEKSYISSLSAIPRALFVISLAVSVVFLLLVSGMVNGMMKAIHLLLNGMNRLGSGEFHLHLPRTHDSEMNMLVDKFNEMDERICMLIQNNYEMHIREKEAQLAALNMQLNPHFLYNTLNTINAMALSNQQLEISRAIVSLSKMMQHTLSVEGECCRLCEEMDGLLDYFELMKFRFMDAFEVRLEIEEALMQTLVPRLIFQPLIENAIVHGFADLEKGGVILLKGQTDPDGMRSFRVEDNGRGFAGEPEGKRSHLGICNVRHRLELLYGNKQEFHISSKTGEGTTVWFRIP